jgi:hypothetical protein
VSARPTTAPAKIRDVDDENATKRDATRDMSSPR